MLQIRWRIVAQSDPEFFQALVLQERQRAVERVTIVEFVLGVGIVGIDVAQA